jgi:hypothetical protein
VDGGASCFSLTELDFLAMCGFPPWVERSFIFLGLVKTHHLMERGHIVHAKLFMPIPFYQFFDYSILDCRQNVHKDLRQKGCQTDTPSPQALHDKLVVAHKFIQIGNAQN